MLPKGPKMSTANVYDDLSNTDLGEKVTELQQQNAKLVEHVRTLQEDIDKLCAEICKMKKREDALKKNISELYNTARVELDRKDRMLTELRQEMETRVTGRQDRYKSGNAYTTNNKRKYDGSPARNDDVKRVKRDRSTDRRHSRSRSSHRYRYKERDRSRSRWENGRNDRSRSRSNKNKYSESVKSKSDKDLMQKNVNVQQQGSESKLSNIQEKNYENAIDLSCNAIKEKHISDIKDPEHNEYEAVNTDCDKSTVSRPKSVKNTEKTNTITDNVNNQEVCNSEDAEGNSKQTETACTIDESKAENVINLDLNGSKEKELETKNCSEVVSDHMENITTKQNKGNDDGIKNESSINTRPLEKCVNPKVAKEVVHNEAVRVTDVNKRQNANHRRRRCVIKMIQ